MKILMNSLEKAQALVSDKNNSLVDLAKIYDEK